MSRKELAEFVDSYIAFAVELEFRREGSGAGLDGYGLYRKGFASRKKRPELGRDVDIVVLQVDGPENDFDAVFHHSLN
jgi:hypothetical protein